MSTESTCVIYIDDTKIIHAIDLREGKSFEILSSSNASEVFQRAINDISETGGKIFVKAGTYEMTNLILLRSGIILEGESSGFAKGTVFTTDELVFIDDIFFSLQGMEHILLKSLAFHNIYRCSHDSDNTTKVISLNGLNFVTIEDCYFDDCGGSAVFNATNDSDGITISKCFLSRVGSDSYGLNTTENYNYSGIAFHKTKNVLIDGCDIRNCGSSGIVVWSASHQVKIVNCTVIDNDQKRVFGQGHGIIVGGGYGETEPKTEEVIISENHCLNNGGNGIEANSLYGKKTIVSNNICIGNGFNPVGTSEHPQYRAGIYTGHYNTLVCGNQVEDNYGNGIKVGNEQDGWANTMVSGNFIGNNNKGWYEGQEKYKQAGITMNVGYPTEESGFIPKTVIRDNIIYNKEDEHQYFGVLIRTGAKNFVVEDNYFYGNLIGVDWTEDRNSGIVRRNTGFNTETTGTDIILSGENSVVVMHGLNIFPLPQGFQVTPLANLSPPPENNFWIEAIGESTFTIRIKRKTGHDIEFAWSYRKW